MCYNLRTDIKSLQWIYIQQYVCSLVKEINIFEYLIPEARGMENPKIRLFKKVTNYSHRMSVKLHFDAALWIFYNTSLILRVRVSAVNRFRGVRTRFHCANCISLPGGWRMSIAMTMAEAPSQDGKPVDIAIYNKPGPSALWQAIVT